MRPEIFSGYCPKCDSALGKNASFCSKCGKSLIDHTYRSRLPEKLSLEATKKLYEETYQLFIVWLFSFALAIICVVSLRFHGLITIPIMAITVFIYIWVLVLAQMDKLACQTNQRLARLVYASLFIPVIGTIYTFFRISQITKNNCLEANSN